MTPVSGSWLEALLYVAAAVALAVYGWQVARPYAERLLGGGSTAARAEERAQELLRRHRADQADRSPSDPPPAP